MHEDKVVGVIAVQSYSADIHFSVRDQDLLDFRGVPYRQQPGAQAGAGPAGAGPCQSEQRVSERTRELAEANAELVEQIGERMRAERKLIHQTRHDVLTGCPNRLQLLERLGRATASAADNPQACFAVLFMDLDRFKLVNDSVGHAVGDELLVEAGRRIVGAVRATTGRASRWRRVRHPRRRAGWSGHGGRARQACSVGAQCAAVVAVVGNCFPAPASVLRCGICATAAARKCCVTPTPRCTGLFHRSRSIVIGFLTK